MERIALGGKWTGCVEGCETLVPYLWQGLRPIQNFMTPFRANSILKPAQIADVMLLVASFGRLIYRLEAFVRWMLFDRAHLFDGWDCDLFSGSLGSSNLFDGFFGNLLL